jgi:hypothetical protein
MPNTNVPQEDSSSDGTVQLDDSSDDSSRWQKVEKHETMYTRHRTFTNEALLPTQAPLQRPWTPVLWIDTMKPKNSCQFSTRSVPSDFTVEFEFTVLLSVIEINLRQKVMISSQDMMDLAWLRLLDTIDTLPGIYLITPQKLTSLQ